MYQVLELSADVLKRIPEEIDYEQTAKIMADDPSPLNVVLLQEVRKHVPVRIRSAYIVFTSFMELALCEVQSCTRTNRQNLNAVASLKLSFPREPGPGILNMLLNAQYLKKLNVVISARRASPRISLYYHGTIVLVLFKGIWIKIQCLS